MRTLRPLTLILLFTAPALAAQAPQVDADIALLKKKPKGMDEETWREKRRDAARELGDLADKRAVDPLLEIVESERFDAILEIAIQSLGKLGDAKAVPALKRIAEDPSIETYVRDTAREALRKLGAAPAEPTPGEGHVATTGTPDLASLVKTQSQVEGLPPLSPPQVPASTLALAETLTIVGDPAVNLVHDSAGGGTLFDLALTGDYLRQMELAKLGYTFEAAVRTSYHSISSSAGGMDTSRYLIGLGAGISADVRGYLIENLPLFEFATVAPSISFNYVKERAAMETTQSATVTDLSFAGGVGYGRVLPVGSRLRLHRIEQVLESAGLRARPISPDAAARIQLAWYGLRTRLGWYAELVYTLRILREAGVLLQEPDAATVYKILQVIEDAQLDDRQEGMDLRVGGYDAIESAERDQPSFGGVLWAGTLAHQMGDRSDFVGHLRGFLRANQDPKGVLTSADATFRLFFYSAEQDPQGALGLGLFTNLCDDACPEGPTTGLVWELGARAAFTRYFSRAANLSAGVELATESAEAWRVLFTLRAQYGLAPASLVF